MELEQLSDHYIMTMYESIRKEVRVDAKSHSGLPGAAAKERAETLRVELDRRGLFWKPIDWHS
ncbi:hypothetical protein ABIB73_006056 [Bradyrhizobium sp. F1.4.3]